MNIAKSPAIMGLVLFTLAYIAVCIGFYVSGGIDTDLYMDLTHDETVVVYFSKIQKNGEDEFDCTKVYPVERSISGNRRYEEALRVLFAGPTNTEKSQGFTSLFSESTKHILRSVRIEGSTAYVNLEDIRHIIPSASASCAGSSFLASVGETLKHDSTIHDVVYAINGNPYDFYEWMQIGCPSEQHCDPGNF